MLGYLILLADVLINILISLGGFIDCKDIQLTNWEECSDHSTNIMIHKLLRFKRKD